MEENAKEVLKLIIIASVVIVVLCVFTLLTVVIFVRKRKLIEHEKQVMKANYEQALLQSQLEIQEQTLRGISHEIHDNIGQVLSLVSLNLNTIHAADGEKLAATENLVQKAIQDLRNLSKTLNPDRVQQMGLKGAVSSDLQYIGGTGKYTTALEADDCFPDFDGNETVIIYRIMQEVTNNIIKHAAATEIHVEMKLRDGKPVIAIKDNGKGFVNNGTNGSGIGLQNIKHRASLVHAEVEIKSAPGSGTTVLLNFNGKENGVYSTGR